MEQIGPEFPLAHLIGQAAVRGGQDAHIDLDGLVAAHAGHHVILQHAQQFYLKRSRHVAHLVQEYRPAVGALERPLAQPGGAR